MPTIQPVWARVAPWLVRGRVYSPHIPLHFDEALLLPGSGRNGCCSCTHVTRAWWGLDLSCRCQGR